MYLSNRDGNGKTSEEGHFRIQTNILSGDILQASALSVSPTVPVSMNVLVSPGDFKIDSGQGFSYTGWNSSSQTVPISTADPVNPRITSLILYVDKSASTSPSPPNNPGIIKLVAVNGTPAVSPSSPASSVIQSAIGSGNPYIVIADIRVNNGVTTILPANITDRRKFITLNEELYTADGKMLASETRKIASQAAVKQYVDFNYNADTELTNFNSPNFLKPRKWKITTNNTMSSIANRPTNAVAGFGETMSISGDGVVIGTPYTYATQVWKNYTGETFSRTIYTDGSGNATYGVWNQMESVPDAGWFEYPMQNGWVWYGPEYDKFGFMKDSAGFVHLKGLVRSGTSSVVYQLPAGYRPLARRIFPCVSNQAFARCDVESNGVISFQNYNNGWVSLEGISFKAEQ